MEQSYNVSLKRRRSDIPIANETLPTQEGSKAVIICRIVQNAIGSVVAFASMVVFFVIKDAIEEDVFGHTAYYQMANYYYVAGGMMCVVTTAFGFCVILDVAILTKWPFLDDIRKWYTQELDNILELHLTSESEELELQKNFESNFTGELEERGPQEEFELNLKDESEKQELPLRRTGAPTMGSLESNS